MKSWRQLGSLSALLVLGLAACEVLIMISPFAGFFYAGVRFEPLLGFLSQSGLTAWLDGFFLNHSVVTTSWFLEWQRKVGTYLFAAGLWGFLISATQVYGCKIRGRGVATGLLYRVSRHPQYLCLGMAGWGLLTIWPRFLLLGLWVTMLFLYAALARFEERRMEERFGAAYREYAAPKSAFLPGSPVRRLFESTFGRLRPQALGWAAAYVFCLLLAFSGGFALRAYTRSHTVSLPLSDQSAVVISAWPQSEAWAAAVFNSALSAEGVRQHLQAGGEHPIVATILPPHYVMKGMFYKLPPEESSEGRNQSGPGFSRIARIAAGFLFPWLRSGRFMGVDPDSSHLPAQVVFSRAEKPFKHNLPFDEVLDASVRLTPLVVVEVQPPGKEVARVQIPLPQNRWGPQVVMPIF